MKIRIVSIILAITINLTLNGQVNRYGVPLHSTYSVELSGGSEYNHCITKDQNGIVYIGNDARGVIRYDGTNWSLIPVRNEPTLYAIQSDRNSIIYVGGSYEFGYIAPRADGSLNYFSLAERIDTTINVRTVFSIVVKDDRVHFSANRGIFTYFPSNDSLSFFDTGVRGFRNLLTMISVKDRVFVTDNLAGILEFKDDTIFSTPKGEFFTRKVSTVMIPYDDDQLLVGTYDSGLFIYNYVSGEVKDSFVSPGLNERFQKAQIYRGTAIGDSLFAFGTRNIEGVVVLSRKGELVSQYTSENISMDNDGVTAMYYDQENPSELWISSVGFFTRVYINLPFTHFSNTLGVNSGVNTITEFNGTVYIGHDNGVSKLITGSNGSPVFTELPVIAEATPTLELFNNGREKFLLAGTQSGVYIIDGKDNVLSVEKSIVSGERSKRDVRKVLQSRKDPSLVYFGAANSLVFIRYLGNTRWTDFSIFQMQGIINGILEMEDGAVWYSTIRGKSVYRLQISENDTIRTEYNETHGLPDTIDLGLIETDGNILVTSPAGVFRYDKSRDFFVAANDLFDNFTKDYTVTLIRQDNDGDFWLCFNESNSKGDRFLEAFMANGEKSENFIINPFRALPLAPTYDIAEIDNHVWLAKSKIVFVVDKELLQRSQPTFKTFLNKIVIGVDSVYMAHSFTSTDSNGRLFPAISQDANDNVKIEFRLNDISFFWSSNYYVNEDGTQYSYFLEGNDKRWSNWEILHYKDFSNLKYGHYIFRLKAKSVTGIISEEAVFEFTILKPWYAKTGAIILYILVLVGIILAIIKAYTRRLINENLRLEGIVAERTAVVVKQKEELESSIHYASRIQRALLPSEKILAENINDYFLLLKPRDIVSGDFYWMTKRSDKLFIVAADCTGHGVPGAFMSLLGMSFLHEIVNKSDIQRTDNILGELRLYVTNSLKQVGEDDEAKDGMDMSIMMVDFKTRRIEFSGAYNPCFKVRKMSGTEREMFKKGEFVVQEGVMSDGRYVLETIQASKMPIGISARMGENFSLYEWDIEEGVSYYMFSDGYVDQFGSNGKKFMKKNFKRLLIDIQDHPMSKQKSILEETLKQWMGDTPQIDDILVLGIRM